MKSWIFTLFGIAAIIGGAYMIYLKWDQFVDLLLLFLGFFLVLLGVSLLSGPRIYMMRR
jgi:hypothetical protein